MTRRTTLLLAAGVAVVVAVVAVVAVVVVRSQRGGYDTELERAFALAPDDALRYSWTDWAAVRDELGLDLSADSTPSEVQVLLDQGFDADLTSTTALRESALALQEGYGFSPASLAWELFGQSETAAVLVMGLAAESDDAFDDVAERVDAIAERLAALGYTEPEEPDGVWVGDPGVITEAGDVTPELLFVALDAERGLVIGSDTQVGAEQGLESVAAEEAPAEGLSDVVLDAGEPLSAAIYTGDHACGALSMGQADTVDQDQGEQLLAAAGEVWPLSGFAMGAQPGGDVRVSMSFETPEQARTNADTRAALASGPAPGQGGDFADRFDLGPVTADGRVVRMTLETVEGTFLLSDLSTGPVLFATC